MIDEDAMKASALGGQFHSAMNHQIPGGRMFSFDDRWRDEGSSGRYSSRINRPDLWYISAF